MIVYLNGDNRRAEAEDVHHVDITPEITRAGKQVLGDFRAGWFPARPCYPGGIFYQLGAAQTFYASNAPHAVCMSYYFEVRAKSARERDRGAMDLCGVLSRLYGGRRGQYDDSFEDGGTYIKRITFTFTVNIGE